MRALREFGVVFGAFVFLSVALAAAWSQYEWGFPFERPALHHSVRQMSSLDGLGFFSTGWGPVENTKKSLYQDLEGTDPYPDPYYDFKARVLVAARDAGFNPRDALQIPKDQIDALVHAFRTSDLPALSNKGYDSDKGLRGLIAAFKDSAGRPLVILAMCGGEVSNDHYPYYEVLLDGRNPERFQVIHSQMFYFDVSGIEGLEWPATLILTIFPSGIFVLLVVLCVLVVDARRARTRLRGNADAS